MSQGIREPGAVTALRGPGPQWEPLSFGSRGVRMGSGPRLLLSKNRLYPTADARPGTGHALETRVHGLLCFPPDFRGLEGFSTALRPPSFNVGVHKGSKVKPVMEEPIQELTSTCKNAIGGAVYRERGVLSLRRLLSELITLSIRPILSKTSEVNRCGNSLQGGLHDGTYLKEVHRANQVQEVPEKGEQGQKESQVRAQQSEMRSIPFGTPQREKPCPEAGKTPQEAHQRLLCGGGSEEVLHATLICWGRGVESSRTRRANLNVLGDEGERPFRPLNLQGETR